jgi:ATP synthase protein I
MSDRLIIRNKKQIVLINLQMAKNEQDENGNSPMSAYAKYSSVGFQMIAIIGLFTYAGYKIDQSANHQTKWVTAILSLLGVFISLYIVIVSLKK